MESVDLKEQIHYKIIQNIKSIEEWFLEESLCSHTPFYSSFDMRDGGYKITNVDANLFPAGFNNICEIDREEAPDRVSRYIRDCYKIDKGSVALLTEMHTKNSYYWENVIQIKQLIQEAGFEVWLCVPEKIPEPLLVESVSGEKLKVHSWWGLKDQGVQFDVVLNNNDFSSKYEQWEKDSETSGLQVNPPWKLGWRWRRKGDYFKHFNQLVEVFAQMIDVDPWRFTVRTKTFDNFSITDPKSCHDLAQVVQEQVDCLSQDYQRRSIECKPTVFVKNNSGTYGMGVVAVESGEDFLGLNNKIRKKLKGSKGGGNITEVIVQEGVPSSLRSDLSVAEPVLYLVGGDLVGGFLRTHQNKGATDNLNSPGAVFKRLCVSDIEVNVEGALLENVYGWIARIGVLALAKEIEAKGIKLF